jgi:hypothetical protein
MQCFAVLLPVQPRRIVQDLREKGDVFMRIALAVAFGLIAAAPFIGRWRANVWLKNHMREEQVVNRVPEIA